jgi:hypothetical protein
MYWQSWQDPKPGETRVSKYFALWPAKLDDGYTVWLESYWAIETWNSGEFGTGFGYWQTTKTSREHPDKPNTGTPVRRS